MINPKVLVKQVALQWLLAAVCTASAAAAVDLDPVLVGKWPLFGRDPVLAVAVRGTHAYLASGAVGGLQIVDISNPANPLPIGGINTADAARAVALAGDYAFVADRGPPRRFWRSAFELGFTARQNLSGQLEG